MPHLRVSFKRLRPPFLFRLLTLLTASWLLAAPAASAHRPATSGAGAEIGPAATTISVTTTADELNSDGDCSLREAVQAANSDSAVDGCAAGSGADNLTVPAGIYTISLAGVSEDSNATGDFDLTGTITLEGAGATIIDGASLDRVFDVSSGATVSLLNLTIRNGRANVGGGAVRNRGTLVITTSDLSGNSTTANFGGAILSDNAATTTVAFSTLRGNSSSSSASAMFVANGSVARLINSTVSGNPPPAGESALYNNSTGTLTIRNSTINANGDKAIITFGTVDMQNSIVTGHTGNECQGNVTGSANLIDDASCGAGAGNLGAITNFDTTLADNGGPTLTHALLAGSNALNTGANGCPDATGSPLASDQRGLPRPYGAACDIGAFEFPKELPAIFGAPLNQAIVGQPYSFDAEAASPTGAALTFAIANKPAWASFDPASGVLSGTPAASDVGTTTGIVISISDGVGSVSLEPFDLVVVASAEAANEAPVFRNVQLPSTVNVGERFFFDPQAFDPDGDALTFSVENKPAWLSFDPASGVLSGVPTANDVGTVSGIVLRATDSPPTAISQSGNQSGTSTKLGSVQVNNPSLPFKPSSLTYCAPQGGSFAPQTIAFEQATTIADDNELYGSKRFNFSIVRQEYNFSGYSTWTLTPGTSGLPLGVSERQISFTYKGKPYTVPVKLIIGGSCTSGGAGGTPPPANGPGGTVTPSKGTLDVSRSQLGFGARLGTATESQQVMIKSTGAALNWSAQADQPWVTLQPAKGQTPGSLTVGVNMAQIRAAGTQTAKVVIIDENNQRKEIGIALNVSPAPSVSGGTNTGAVVLTALEVTQGLQNLRNTMPLIKGRTTFVRAHVRSGTGQDIDNVTAKLKVTLPNGTTRELAPANENGSIKVLVAPQRKNLDDSFYFQLDQSMLSGKISVELVAGSHQIACSELPGCKTEVEFTLNRPVLPVHILVGTQTYDGKTYTVQDKDKEITRIRAILEAYMPAARVEITESTWSVAQRVTDSKSRREVLTLLAEKWRKEGSPKRHYVALLLHPDGDGATANLSSPLIVISAYNQTLMAHEFIHNYGLSHVAEDQRYPDYVRIGERLSEAATGPDAYFGFVNNNAFPKSYKVMDNGIGEAINGGYWISVFTYNHILEQTATKYGPTLASSSIAAAGSPLTMVRGSISVGANGLTGVINEAIETRTAGDVVIPTGGSYSIRLENSSGAAITTVPFELEQATDIDPADSTNSFSVAIPQSLDSSVARLVLLAGDKPLATLNAPSDGAPVVNGLTALDGIDSVSVTANVQDAQQLSYLLEYSHDGGTTWNDVAAGETAVGALNIALNKSGLPGGTSSRLRLSLADGFHTTIIDQDTTAAFTIANTPPTATIEASFDDTTVVGSQELVLKGSGFDLEDGQLSDNSLIWHSDRDGILGYGETLVVAADTLSEGRHLISLEARDSQGASSIVTRTGNVALAAAGQAALPAQDDQPATTISAAFVQVYRDRPYIPPTLQASDATLSVRQGATVTTTLSIRNSGDGGPLNWNVASASLPPWLKLAKTSGQTPDELVATIDASALTAGSYSTTITLQSSNAVRNGSQDVTVTVEVLPPIRLLLPIVFK